MSTVEDGWRMAVEARMRAHCPDSGFRVGAAVKAAGHDLIVPGCNVENASFGATICAERVALFGLRAQFGDMTPEWLILVTDDDPVAVPCALCRQVIAEFCDPSFPIHLANLDGIQETVCLEDLYPRPFNRAALERAHRTP